MSAVPCHDFSWPGDWVRDALAQADSALRAGRWDEARHRFTAVLTEAEAPEALEGLATAAWYSGDGDHSFAAAGRAYLVYRREGDRVGAARVAVALAWRHMTSGGERAIVSGWTGRARRLLEGQRLTPVHAWLTLCRSAASLFLDDDTTSGLSHANKAVELGQVLGRADLEMAGVALQGVGLVGDGAVTEGLRRLDEAGAAVVAGEVTDPAAIELVAGCVVDGCVRAHDDGRTMHWYEQLQRVAAGRHLPALLPLHGTNQVTALIAQQGVHGVQQRVPERQDAESGLEDLTAREREVLDLVGKGLTNGEISARLVLSKHTVHRHIANIRTKLGVSTRAAAVAIGRGESRG